MVSHVTESTETACRKQTWRKLPAANTSGGLDALQQQTYKHATTQRLTTGLAWLLVFDCYEGMVQHFDDIIHEIEKKNLSLQRVQCCFHLASFDG